MLAALGHAVELWRLSQGTTMPPKVQRGKATALDVTELQRQARNREIVFLFRFLLSAAPSSHFLDIVVRSDKNRDVKRILPLQS